jgi:hypothetical protein
VVEADLQRDGERRRRADGLPHDFHFARRTSRSARPLVHALVDEGKAVARAAAIELHDDPWEMNVLATQRGIAHFPSMLEDVEAGAPTEVELINGALVREAAPRVERRCRSVYALVGPRAYQPSAMRGQTSCRTARMPARPARDRPSAVGVRPRMSEGRA